MKLQQKQDILFNYLFQMAARGMETLQGTEAEKAKALLDLGPFDETERFQILGELAGVQDQTTRKHFQMLRRAQVDARLDRPVEERLEMAITRLETLATTQEEALVDEILADEPNLNS